MDLTLIDAEGAVPRSNHNTFVFMPNATEMGVPYWMFKIVHIGLNIFPAWHKEEKCFTYFIFIKRYCCFDLEVRKFWNLNRERRRYFRLLFHIYDSRPYHLGQEIILDCLNCVLFLWWWEIWITNKGYVVAFSVIFLWCREIWITNKGYVVVFSVLFLWCRKI